MNRENAERVYAGAAGTFLASWCVAAGTTLLLGPVGIPLVGAAFNVGVGAWCVGFGTVLVSDWLPAAETPTPPASRPVQQEVVQETRTRDEKETEMKKSGADGASDSHHDLHNDVPDDTNSVDEDYYDQMNVDFADEQGEFFEPFREAEQAELHKHNPVRHTQVVM